MGRVNKGIWMGDGAKGTPDSQDKQTDGLDCTRTCIRKERKKERKRGEKILVPVCVWHNIIIVLGESMSWRGEMGLLKDEFDIIFLRATWLST